MTDDPIQQATNTPSLEMLDRLQSDFSEAGQIEESWGRVKRADDTRFCRWPGQNPDGRKRSAGDKPAFPWEGASDTRPMVVDDTINDLVSLCTTAFWRAIAAGKAADDQTGAYAVALLDFFVNDQMTDSLVDEVELSAQYMQHYGWVVLNPTWEQKTALRVVKVRLDELAALGQQMAQGDPNRFGHLAVLGETIMDPAQADAAATGLGTLFSAWLATQPTEAGQLPMPKMGDYRKAVVRLRREGEARVPVPYLMRNQPMVYALQPWAEVLLPADTTDLQAGRVIFQREYLGEADLRARVLDEGYSEAWVEEALRHKGGRFGARPLLGVSSLDNTDKEDLIEVVHAVYKASDSDGVPGVYCTTFHPLVRQDDQGQTLVAKHELVDYGHGEYPYVLGKREHLSRQALASRGVAEVAATWQNEEKALRDGVIDWTQIGVIPPVNVYQDPKQLKYKFGPAVQNFVRLGREPSFMPMPTSGVPGALTALDGLHVRRCQYFGTAHSLVPPEVTQVRSMRTVQRFLAMWMRAFRQVLALAQQFMPDPDFARITGAPEGWLDSRRRVPFLLSANLSFDTRELNEELMLKRLEVMNKMVLPSDSQGTIQRAKWTEIQVRAVNPAWAKELVQGVAEGSQALFERVQQDIAMMYLGNAPQMVESDPTAQGKLTYAQQIVQANPNYVQELGKGGRFTELLQAYAKNLSFSLTQEQNKQIGRIGVQPPQ